MSLLRDAILVSDLHLTDNPRDEYRWGLFDFLLQECRRLQTKDVLILGDLTDAKDYHSASLVNRIVENLDTISSYAQVTVLRGNHDGTDPEKPYFRFLNHLEAVDFIAAPERRDGILLLPHSRDPVEEWGHLDMTGVTVLAHATVTGAVAEAGVQLAGVPRSLFAAAKQVISGDVHVPQKIGNVEYVGAPYPIRFGDKFVGRCLAFKDGVRQPDLHYQTLARRTLRLAAPRQVRDAGLRPGDQVKVELHLDPGLALSWEKQRAEVIRICAELKLELCGLSLHVEKPTTEKRAAQAATHRRTDEELVRDFCDREKIGEELEELGRTILSETA